MKKKVIAIFILLVVIGIAVATVVFMDKQSEKKEQSGEQPRIELTAKLPNVNIYYNDEAIGSLIGYVTPMDSAVLRENLAVVTADSRKFDVEIVNGEVEIGSVSYEIRTNDGERLVDGGDISNFSEEQSRFTISVSAILENNTEYSLVIIANTEEYGEVYYYSRLMVVAEEFLSAQLAFAKEFSENTLDDQKSTDLVKYMEPDATLANNNLGFVNLTNNFDVLTWGSLAPEKITDTEVELKEVYVKATGVSGTYQMKYQVHAEGSNEIIEVYNIVETITVWTFNEKQYVLDYERTMNQIWEANENTVRNSFIDLGIQRDTEMEFIESSDGSHVAYIANGQLWLADITGHKLTRVYEIAEINDEATRIMLTTVGDDGTVDFIVYGYQSGNIHRGKNGVSVCRYSKEENSVDEMVFIKSDKPANILESKIGKLCHMNDSVLYLMVEDVIYYVNLITREYGKLTENLKEGNYAINKDRNIIAYNTGGELYNSDSITVSNLTDNTSKIIEAGEGNKIKICGYSGNHLVYGIAPESQVDADKGKMNMSVLKIVDENLEELTSYEKEKIYITEVSIADSIIHLKRIKKGKEIEDDQLIDNTVVQGEVVSSSYYEDTKKYRELALSLATNIGTMEEVDITSPAVFVTSTEPMNIIEARGEEKVYYIYASGILKGITDTKQLAEQTAKENNGLVINASGEKIWTFEENYE